MTTDLVNTFVMQSAIILDQNRADIMENEHDDDGNNVDNDILRYTIDWSRISELGQIFPMSDVFTKIRYEVLLGLGVTAQNANDIIMSKSRKMLQLGIWMISDDIKLATVLIEPANVSSSWFISNISISEVLNAMKNIRVLSPSTNAADECVPTLQANGVRIQGRLAASVLTLLTKHKNSTYHVSAVSIHLGNTSLRFYLCFGIEVYICGTTDVSLALIRSNLPQGSRYLDNVTGLTIYGFSSEHEDGRTGGNGNVRLYNDGAIRYNGKPEQIRIAFSRLSYSIAKICNDPYKRRSFILTLSRIETLSQ
ncbi:hypothetical protein HDV02_002479 [Globomyces sp. JEL0801]|nr:hypothetical protein HDV02_002479 [Globomyces sp. JEL0801]